ncbi:MAG: S-layer homology domain-containing protein [Acutalibacter sp.]
MEVTFANNSNRIYFNTDGEDGGTIAAADSSGNPLESGASVGHGADVTFTAEPESGYMVESWTVDGEVYTWPGTDEPYRESTLTLENIAADRTVTVWFEQAARTTVHTGVVDVDGQSSSAATISVTNAGSEPLSPNEDGTYTVRRDTSLIFMAHLTSSDNNTVREWQSSTDGVAWTTIAGSGGQDTLTVYNPEDEHLYIRAVVATAQNFSLLWKVQMSEGEAPEEANASLTAVSNGVALTNGSDQPAYVAVDFTLTLNNAYYVVNWSGNVDSDGTTARLESLTADTEVTVNIAEDVSGGSVTVKGTVNGVVDTVVANGGYVDNGTAITITADPQNGYVVNTINDKSVNSDKTNGSKDLAVENVTADISATATFLAKPTVTIGSAVGGTVTATGTVDGSSVELSTGSYVDFGTEISVTLAPATGYVVDTGAMGVGDLAYDAVAYVYENGIMAGTDETIFDPYMELDRAQAAQLFYNLEGQPTVTGDSTFTDVTSGHWAVDAITWAAQNDIVAGIGGGLYDPDSNVTREQFAVILYKYARFKGYDLTATGDLTQFPDAGSISSWAETALSWANGNGLINGNEDGTLAPGGTATRAQAASILAQFDQSFIS